MTAPYYQDEWVTLYHGDCLEVTDWLSADVLVTDPPYGINWASGQTSYTSPRQVVTTVNGDQDTTTRDAALSLWAGRPALVFGCWKASRPIGTKHRLIWHKAAKPPGLSTGPWFAAEEEIYVLGGGFTGPPQQNVIRTSELRHGAVGEAAKVGHPTPKPIALMEALITKCPTGVIADSFAGSGSTLVAAKALNRQAIGVEIEERYCELTVNRLAQGVLDLGAVG